MAAKFLLEVKDVDHGWEKLRKLMRGISSMADRKSFVKSGLVGKKAEETREGGLTNAQVGAIQEFGSPSRNIPSRSFIRATFDRFREQYIAMLKPEIKKVYGGEGDMEKALGRVGVKMAADMKNSITQGAGIPPPNAPSVLARKRKKGRPGSSGEPRTLVDKGKMLGAISWEVVMDGEDPKE